MRNIHGGGSKTNEHGLLFEKGTDVKKMFSKAGADTKSIVFKGKAGFSKYVKSKYGFDTKTVWSKQLLPDEALFIGDTIYIIEKKWQQVDGSVDEKLQTCDFKRRQYEKVGDTIGMKVKYVFLLNDFFKNPKYSDVFEYITDVGCYHFFNEIPIDFFNL